MKKLLKWTQWAFDITIWIAGFVVLGRAAHAGNWDMVALSILAMSAFAEARFLRLERDGEKGKDVEE